MDSYGKILRRGDTIEFGDELHCGLYDGSGYVYHCVQSTGLCNCESGDIRHGKVIVKRESLEAVARGRSFSLEHLPADEGKIDMLIKIANIYLKLGEFTLPGPVEFFTRCCTTFLFEIGWYVDKDKDSYGRMIFNGDLVEFKRPQGRIGAEGRNWGVCLNGNIIPGKDG